MTKLNSDIDPKLSDAVVQKLEQKHIRTVIQFIDEDSAKLVTFTELSLKDIIDIKQNILKKCGGIIRSASDVLQIEQNNIISTGLLCLDELLKGGLYPGQIYEICGISSSGKTQLCFTIACNIALKPNTLVWYIDTKRDFSGSRIEQMLLRKNYSKQVVDEIMNSIKVWNVQNCKQLFKVLHWLKTALKEEKECCTKLIIIDSLSAIIYQYFHEHKSNIALNYLANMCRYIANEFHISVITVNVITQWNTPDTKKSASTSSSDNTISIVKALLGSYWSSVPNTRLLIEKIGSGNRKLSIWKSFQLKQNIYCTFSISDCGVVCS
ncbi:rad51 recombinase D [Calliopsis andreniformis]|uniref:rad51 recombinase D n=1 Tax=Calliopsis andreniformis TaxID=337506 RepID=UPI003FCC600F